MKIIVMKFGGSSLAEPEKIKVMAERAVKARAGGYSVVMAVSAPADLTDDLITLSKLITPVPQAREYDALLSTGENKSRLSFRRPGGHTDRPPPRRRRNNIRKSRQDAPGI
jgi:aspartate kinase